MIFRVYVLHMLHFIQGFSQPKTQSSLHHRIPRGKNTPVKPFHMFAISPILTIITLTVCSSIRVKRQEQQGFLTKGWIVYLLLIRKIWMIKLFVNREQIRLLNSKTTDLDWYYFKPYQKLKLLIRDLLFTTFVKSPRVNIFKTLPLLRDDWILLSGKLILISFARMDKLKIWKISILIHNDKLIFIRTS